MCAQLILSSVGTPRGICVRHVLLGTESTMVTFRLYDKFCIISLFLGLITKMNFESKPLVVNAYYMMDV